MKKNNKSDKNPEYHFKFQVISAVAISLVILLLLGIYAIYQTHYQHLEEKIDNTMRSVVNLYEQTLAIESEQIAAVLEVIVDNKNLVDDLMHKDRIQLLSKNRALFDLLKERYNITHFYFTDADRVNIVRFHNPPRYGDTINRYTTLEAERRKDLFYGVEMGASGMFTLRVVKPIFQQGVLIGYVELGREIGHIIKSVSKIMKVDIYTTLKKSVVERTDWEESMRQMGESTDWEQFPDLLLVNWTAVLNEKVQASLSRTEVHYNDDDAYFYQIKQGYYDDSSFVVFAPLHDVTGLDVGHLVVYLDFSRITELAYNNIINISIIGVCLVLVLLVFSYLVLSRIQHALMSYRMQGEEAARLREVAQAEHLALMRVKSIELEEQSNRMTAIVDKAVDGIITIDCHGIISTFNPAAGQIFGYLPEKVIGQKINMLMPEPDRTQHDDYLKHYLQTGEQRMMNTPREVFGVHRSGREIPILLAVSEVKMQGKQTFVGIVHDISDHKRAEMAMRQRNEALERSNRDLENFAYVASHDLQEPLRKIRAFGDRLQQRAGEQFDEKSQDYMDRMLNAATRMQALISDLLSFSRLGSNAKPFEKVRLADVLTGVISDLETRIEETGAVVNIGELPTLEADALQMRQLFQNLIGNALKFQREGVSPVISVNAQKLAPNGGRGGLQVPLWEITVTDNGVGFDEKYATLIFQVFQRLHHRGSYEGTGIGLAICRKIVDRHDGTIHASGKPNGGAVFRIVLPEKHEQKDENWLETST